MTGATLETLLAAAVVDPAVHAPRPDCVALVLAADGPLGGPSVEAARCVLAAPRA